MPMFRDNRARLAVAFLVLACGPAAAMSSHDTPPPSLGAAIPTDVLADLSGGSDTTNNVNEQTLNGTMSDTEAKNTISGGNIVSGSAFGSSAGLPTVIQNSGNNVLIQNATIVTVRMTP